MSVAVYLNESTMRILWPPQVRPSSRATISRPRIPSVSAAAEFAIALPNRETPPVTTRYFRYKFVFGGNVKLKAPMLNGARPAPDQFGIGVQRGTDGSTEIGAKYEKAISDSLTAEFTAGVSDDNFSLVCQHIAQGNWNAAIAEMFAVKLKGAIPLTDSSSVAFEFDLSADKDLCFFGATGKPTVAVPLDGLLDIPRGYVVEVEAPITFRFGLTEAGWTWVAKRIGGPAIRAATNRIAVFAAQQAVRSALTTAGIYGIAIVGGLGLMYVSTELCDAARAEGERWGILSTYCKGYLSRLRFAHAGAYERRQIRSFVNGNRRRQAGWRDAERAIRHSGLAQVERTVIRHFASDYDVDVFDSIWNWELRGSDFASRVGSTVNNEHEVSGIAIGMSEYLASEIDEVVAYLGRANAGGFIQQTDAQSRR